MKIIEGFKLRKLGKESVVVGEGLAQVNFNKMISLNASAAYLWEAVEGKEFSAEDLADLLVKKYDVSRDVALSDAKSLAEKWLSVGLVK